MVLRFTFRDARITPMIVCSCAGTTDRTIRTLVRNRGCSLSEIARACNAGAGCGGCHATLEELVASTVSIESADEEPRRAELATAL